MFTEGCFQHKRTLLHTDFVMFFSIFCPCFDFPLLRIFSSHFYYFPLQSPKNRILFQLKTKTTAAPSFNRLASTLPFYFHLIRNRFSRSHANKTDDNLLSNTPIFWVVSVWLYPLLRISSFFSHVATICYKYTNTLPNTDLLEIQQAFRYISGIIKWVINGNTFANLMLY